MSVTASFATIGKLEPGRLHELMLNIYLQRFAGVLRTWKDALVRRLVFSGGRLVATSSTSPDERLGDVMLEAGLINSEQYELVTQLLERGTKKQGQLLLDYGFVDRSQLELGLIYQFRKILRAIHCDGNVRYRVGEDAAVPQGMHIRPADTYDLLRELIWEESDLNTVTAWLGGDDTVFRPRVSEGFSVLFRNCKIEPWEEQVLSLVDGRRTAAEVASRTPLGPILTFKMLYLFQLTGLVSVRSSGS